MPEHPRTDNRVDALLEHARKLEENEARVRKAFDQIIGDLKHYSGLDEAGAYLPAVEIDEAALETLKRDIDTLDPVTRTSLKRLLDILEPLLK